MRLKANALRVMSTIVAVLIVIIALNNILLQRTLMESGGNQSLPIILHEGEDGSDNVSTLRLPNVLLIGVQKGGSSALANSLFDHGICRPRTFQGEPYYWSKEVHLFDKKDRLQRGPAFYASRFEHCFSDAGSMGQLAMDATPNYLPYAEEVRRMYESVGGDQAESLKVIVSLREPVSRDLSLYNHKANEFREKSENFEFWRGVVDFKKSELLGRSELMSFSDYVAKKCLPSINATYGTCTYRGHVNQCLGLYEYFLKRWMRLFRHDQILVVAYDELVRDQAKVLWRLRTFLGLSDQLGPDEVASSNTQSSEHKISSPPCGAQERLARAYKAANNNLYALLESKRGPSMEQRPFPKFTLSNCTSDIER